MKHDELIAALRRLKVETGSLACLGCGHEHNCGAQGCAILREAITALETRPEVVRCRECKLHEHCWSEEVFGFAGLDDDKRFCGVGTPREEAGDGNADSM